MRRDADSPAARWLRRFAEGPTGRSGLVCFPHAGGAASAYRPLATLLAPTLDCVVLQYPGRQDRRSEPARDDLHRLADEVAAVLLPLPAPDRALFFGHSMGASLAFEVARRLEPAGSGPNAIVVSGRRAPSRPRDSRVHEDPDDQLLAEMRRLGGSDLTLADTDLVPAVLPAIRADLAAAERYRPAAEATLTCPITVLTGTDDTEVTRAEAEAWRDHTTGPCALYLFPGGHFFLKDQLPAVSRAIIATMASHTSRR